MSIRLPPAVALRSGCRATSPRFYTSSAENGAVCRPLPATVSAPVPDFMAIFRAPETARRRAELPLPETQARATVASFPSHACWAPP